MPVYGLLTPYPATPLYDRLAKEGRLTRPQHWLDFRPFRMAFTPKGISIRQAEKEVHRARSGSYSARAITDSLQKIRHRPFHERAIMLAVKLAFRGIYFPQMRTGQWIALLTRNSWSIGGLICEGLLLRFWPPRSVRVPEARSGQTADR